MNAKIVRLTFLSPVHFGRGRLSDSAFTCDAGTLFSALFIEALKNDASADLLRAAQSGEFSISDAFPYIHGSLYLPKPMAARQTETASTVVQDSRARKASKKLLYLPSRTFKKYLQGDFDAIGELEAFSKGLGSPYVQTKVNLTRESKDDADPYVIGGFSFAHDAGIYFIVEGSYDVRPLLDSLQYSGLGGKRTSGYGRFSYKIENLSSTELEPLFSGQMGDRSVLLSTAMPKLAELDDSLLEGAHYRLIRRGGFVQSSTHGPTFQKKRDQFLFAAGSVFTKRFSGDVFDVNQTPQAHPVYRYARALWLGV